MTEFLTDGPAGADRTLVLAHGAGAPMDSPFMDAIARGVAAAGVRTVRFEFPYMAERRETGVNKPPSAQAKLLACWREVVDELGPPDQLVIGGKSMGGRIASMVADGCGVRGLVALGYPFHPPGRPDKLRTAHLRELATPGLFVQGERDTFGTRDEVPAFGLSVSIQFLWMPDGDHSFKPRVRSGHTLEGNLAAAVDGVVSFVRGL